MHINGNCTDDRTAKQKPRQLHADTARRRLGKKRARHSGQPKWTRIPRCGVVCTRVRLEREKPVAVLFVSFFGLPAPPNKGVFPADAPQRAILKKIAVRAVAPTDNALESKGGNSDNLPTPDRVGFFCLRFPKARKHHERQLSKRCFGGISALIQTRSWCLFRKVLSILFLVLPHPIYAFEIF